MDFDATLNSVVWPILAAKFVYGNCAAIVLQLCCGNGDIMLYKYNYPKERSRKDAKGLPQGVAGECTLLNKKNLSTQPISSFDWHPDKRGLCAMGSFDQSVRVAIVTQLEKY